MNVMNSPVDLRARDDHLRHLLDQRAARADLHGRFPSLSEFSDSPSVYSHPHFSPRPGDRPSLDGSVQAFRFPQSPQLNSPSSLAEPRSPISDRERLNIPTASSLDLEDDPRSSSEYDSLHDHGGDGGEDDSSPEEDADEEIPRISMYGPKMRFHSPAPWEEEGEEEVARASIDESKRSKKKSESSGKKGWGLARGGGAGTSEPRPSTDSARSGKPKQSFETSSTLSATGALAYVSSLPPVPGNRTHAQAHVASLFSSLPRSALAQASMSSTSLAINPSPQSLRDKLSLPRLRSRTPSNVGQFDPFSASSNNASPISRMTSPADADTDDHSLTRTSTRSATPQYQEYTHPYANPDLVRVANLDPPPSSPNLQASFGTHRSDSNATLTDTTPSSSMSQFRSTTTLSMTPGTSMTSVNPSLSESTSSYTKIGGRGISGPMPVDKSSLPLAALNMLNHAPQSPLPQATPTSPGLRRDHALPGVPLGGISAWHESGSGGGSLKLISLEEAQAQARERSRSATAHPVISSPFASSSKTQLPDPDSDGSQRAQGRARSTSAGAAKGRHPTPMGMTSVGGGGDPSSPSSGGVGPHRQVVRKKSGFMRLFNGKDRDRVSPSSPPPPVPSLSNDAFAASPMPPLPPPPSQYHRSRQGSTHRVPVPPLSLSPTLAGESSAASSSGSGSGSGSSFDSPPSSTPSSGSTTGGGRDQSQLSARRKVPDLSIVTTSPSLPSLNNKVPYNAPLSAGANDVSHTHHLTPTAPSYSDRPRPGHAATMPCSAPPNKTDFVGLSIRPVSTLFSRELKEQLAVDDDGSVRTRPSLEADTGTPTTATTAVSPLSPDFNSGKYGRSSDEKSVGPPAIAHPDERDQSSVIQALQEQILTARRAWQRQIWELEGQVRDLKAEVEELRATDGGQGGEYCAACGRGSARRPGLGGRGGSDDSLGVNAEDLQKAGVKTGGVVNRPRARTGVGSRFASGT
ncbi:hypothetical protein FKP32DRAFT_1613594 [Trametes sanguinea]|nr:hypothetical protein FKP32DRAFT_1613594 [Trametes sanguinea]